MDQCRPMYPMYPGPVSPGMMPYYPSMRMPDIGGIWFTLADPIVRHGIVEHARGISLEHTLRQMVTAGVLVGMGCHPMQAIAAVEQFERMVPGVYARPYAGAPPV